MLKTLFKGAVIATIAITIAACTDYTYYPNPPVSVTSSNPPPQASMHYGPPAPPPGASMHYGPPPAPPITVTRSY